MYDRGNGASNPSGTTVELLAAAGESAQALMAESLKARGSSLLHQSILKVLADLGPHARRDLAARVGAPPAEASRVLDDLQSQGLVQALVVNAGGRQEVMALTAAGTAARATALDHVSGVQDVLLASLTKGERAQLHYLLRRVCASAARSGGSHPASGAR
ncbi:MarR family winged helix-turn-helix transcriptional regulator [Streptomyces goshikiensis]|uniref:MarR family winged helix-turn-helix transcriptional regulator n=1 Tax=Streptomyces goshikiensis TaxID=1942 RepID=UPI0033AACA2B